MFTSRSKWCISLAALAVSIMAGPAAAQPYVYVLGEAGTPDITSHRLRVFNAATGTIVAGVRLGETQGTAQRHIAIAPDGALLYVINNLDFDISVFSTQTNTVVDTWGEPIVGSNPSGVAVSPNSQRLYVAGSEATSGVFQGYLIVVDVASRSKIAKIPLGYEFAYGVAVSPDGARAYVVLSDSPAYAVVVVDITTNSVVTSVPLPGEPSGFSVSLSPDGRFAYFPRIGSGGAGSVQVLDTVTNTIVATTTVGRGPRHVGVSPNGAIVYVPGPQSDQLHQLDPSSHASVGSTAITTPLAVAFTPDSTRAYVAADENLVVMDTATRAVVATIPTIVSRSGFQVGYSEAIVATPPASSVPGSTPTNFRATSIAGNRLTLAWNAPSSGTPTGYVIEGGVAPGQVQGSIATGSTATTFAFDAPSGTFYLRVRAQSASGTTGPSNEIQVVINQAQAPSAPTNLLGLADGSNLTLSWKTANTGGAPTSLILDVGGAATVSLPLPLSEIFWFAGVPPGTYTFAVRAANSAGTSPPSSPVTLTFPSGCAGAPHVPTNFVASRTGSTLSISWDPPAAGPAVASYVLKVAGAFNMSVPMTARSITGNVPSGTYILSVLAVNSCGSGVETATQTVTVP